VSGRERWEYDAGGRRGKHKWPEDFADFEERPDGRKIGKCPSSLCTEEAERLLNEGVDGSSPTSDRADRDWPENIYTVDRDGVIDRAKPTRPGHSYHGFPAGDERRISRRFKEAILELAERKGCKKEAKRWMRQHMNVPSL